MALSQKEYEEMLGDAEKKLERLRASYEQYFQGMEKLQPTIQFKAVERMFFVLMREKPRTTNLRFRANQLIQKWSTYQMYWKRVCRQIEEGTHKKQIERARARRMQKLAEAEAPAPEHGETTAQEAPALPTGKTADGAWEIDPNENIELDMDEFRMDSESKPKGRAKSERPAKPSERPKKSSEAPKPRSERPAPKSKPPAPKVPAEATAAPAEAAPPTAEEPKSGSTPGAYRPPTPGAMKKDQTASRGVKLPPPGAKSTAVGAGTSPSISLPKAAPPAASEAKAAPAKPAPPPMPGKAPAAGKPPQPPPLAPPKPAAASPSAAKPVAAPKAPPGVVPLRPAAAPAGGNAAGPSDADLRRIYDRYVTARKQNNEAVDNVKFEKVRAQIEKMLPALEQKYKGKRIDFDVVVKDGKVGLKPVPKDTK